MLRISTYRKTPNARLGILTLIASGLLVCLFIALMASIVSAAEQPARNILVFDQVNVLAMTDDQIKHNQRVVIIDGMITALGDSHSIDVPLGAKVIDAQGKYLMPGLSDMHSHINAGSNGSDQEVAQNQFLLYLATGVTVVRDAGGSPTHLQYKRDLSAQKILGPELFVASPIFEGENAVWPFSVKATSAAQAKEAIQAFAKQGYWGVKVYHTVSNEVYDAILSESAKHQLPVMGHVPFDVGIEKALKSGQLSIEHLRGYDFDGVAQEWLEKDGGRNAERFGSWNQMSDERMDELVELTIAAGAWNCPTLAINRFLVYPDQRQALTQHPHYHRVHPVTRLSIERSNALDKVFSQESRTAIKASLPRQGELVRRLSERGGQLLVGTDSILPAYIPGFTVIDEIEAFVDAGISNFDALKAATVNASIALGIDEEIGTVEVGKRANLLLLNANALDDIQALWQADGVVVYGQWLSREAIDSMLDDAALSNRVTGSVK